jgi:hypothetical protein
VVESPVEALGSSSLEAKHTAWLAERDFRTHRDRNDDRNRGRGRCWDCNRAACPNSSAMDCAVGALLLKVFALWISFQRGVSRDPWKPPVAPSKCGSCPYTRNLSSKTRHALPLTEDRADFTSPLIALIRSVTL